jgi:hypothetical protein
MTHADADPLRPHSHEPNPEPPAAEPDILFTAPDGEQRLVSVAALRELPQTMVTDCYIVSTGHGTSGPFAFTGPSLLTLLASQGLGERAWSEVEVISADGFGTRIEARELPALSVNGPVLLALQRDGQPLSRRQGLVRLIAPGERDDALRQVKWVREIKVLRGR